MSEEHFRELAAVTEAEEVAAIMAAAGRLAEAVKAWKASPRWRSDRTGGAAGSMDASVTRMMTELAALGGGASLRDVVRAVRGPLGGFAVQAEVAAALEELRVVAMQRPTSTAYARLLTGRQDRRDPQPAPRPEIQVHPPHEQA